MTDRFDHTQRPSWLASHDEKHPTALSSFEQRQRDFDRRREEQQEREALIRERFGADLAGKIAVAIEILDRQNEHIEAIALDLLIESIAESEVLPSQKSSRDLRDLCYHSIDQAFELKRLKQEELEQRQPEPPRESHHYYAALEDAHMRVDEEFHASADQMRQPHEITEDSHQERSHHGRYAELEATHDRVRGEQTDSRREIDDRARARQARARQFGREIEEALHNEMEQDGGRDLGQ